MEIKTIFRCTFCGKEAAESGEMDTAYLLFEEGGSQPHLPCKPCRKKIEKHNGPILARYEAAEEGKRQERLKKRAEIEAKEQAKTEAEQAKYQAKLDAEAAEARKPMEAIAQALGALAETQKAMIEMLQEMRSNGKG